jgi:hypothetical protein
VDARSAIHLPRLHTVMADDLSGIRPTSLGIRRKPNREHADYWADDHVDGDVEVVEGERSFERRADVQSAIRPAFI